MGPRRGFELMTKLADLPVQVGRGSGVFYRLSHKMRDGGLLSGIEAMQRSCMFDPSLQR